MRVLVVSPGPMFSTYDVYRGWRKGLEQCGVEVETFDLEMWLNMYANMRKVLPDGEQTPLFPGDELPKLAAQHLKSFLYDWWPHIVVVVSASLLPTAVFDTLRARGHKLVIIHTESPYEDDRQVEVASHADFNLTNDPTNLDRFRAVAPSGYMPHAYDPDIHHPGTGDGPDVCFVGTGYPSRIEFLEQIDWSGINLSLAGNWQRAKGTALEKYIAHSVEECITNEDAADVYRSSKMAFNLYRKEAERPELSEGWAIGPREVELAACQTFTVREPRGESDELFPMLPSFETPAELEALIREWLPRPADRAEASAAAFDAIADRTFTNHAAQLLRWVTSA